MRNIILNEKQFKLLMENLSGKEIYSEPGPQNPGMKSTNKPYCIDPNKVKIVKKFLDNNFERATMTRIGPNGMQEKVKVVGLLDKDSGNILRNMYLDDLEDQVITRFQNMFSDKNERQLFMNKIINYWFDDKISPLGMLPINHL